MDRRGFLLGTTALLVAGCARVPPSSVSASATPSGTTAAPLSIGQDGTLTAGVLSQLIVGVIQAKGRAGAVVDQAEDWQAALGHGDLSALPAFGGTLWAALSQDDEPPVPAEVLSDVATLLAPEISVLELPEIDGSLVWRVTAETAREGITSLARIASWSKDRVAAVPPLAVSRADGVPGLKAVYGAQFEVSKVSDPVQRTALLASGNAAIAAFRRTEYTGASGLFDLIDIEQLTLPDPGMILVNSALTEAEPDQVLAMDALAQALSTETVRDLQAQVVAGGAVAEVAGQWLKQKGLA